jgi:hypothetical protein
MELDIEVASKSEESAAVGLAARKLIGRKSAKARRRTSTQSGSAWAIHRSISTRISDVRASESTTPELRLATLK